MTFSCRLNSLSFSGLKMLKEQHKFRFSITVERLMYTDYDTVFN